MSVLQFEHIKIEGIAAAVPKDTKVNESSRLKRVTGIAQRRTSPPQICTSDLCFESTQKLLDDLKVDKNSIDILIFISQTPDYKLPVTSTLLQHKLGLKPSTICFDVPLGCSGYTYGLYIISSLLSSSKGNLQKGLLLVGDTISKETNPLDNSTHPLFGDAGTSTLVSYDSKFSSPIKFELGSNGEGYDSIIIPDGGSRNPISSSSFKEIQDEKGNIRSNCNLFLDGMKVFDFGTNFITDHLKNFIHQTTTLEEIDFIILHQANKIMNDSIVKKLNMPSSKALSTLENFGNTSSATIPLTIVDKLNNKFSYNTLLLSGFGVGLSWASVLISQSNIFCSNLIEI